MPSFDLGSAPVPAGPVDDRAGQNGESLEMGPDDVPLAYLPNHGQTATQRTDGFEDELREELRLVDGRCLVVGDDGARVVWPVDYVGMTHGDGSLTLLDQRGEPVAELGDVLRLRGSWRGHAGWGAGEPCLPDGMVFMVQAVPEVVG